MSKPLLRRVLLTNDDGIAAPGLALLERIAAQLAEEVWVVAPEHEVDEPHELRLGHLQFRTGGREEEDEEVG